MLIASVGHTWQWGGGAPNELTKGGRPIVPCPLGELRNLSVARKVRTLPKTTCGLSDFNYQYHDIPEASEKIRMGPQIPSNPQSRGLNQPVHVRGQGFPATRRTVAAASVGEREQLGCALGLL